MRHRRGVQHLAARSGRGERASHVTDVITVACIPSPKEHLLQYWLDYKGPGDEYSRLNLRAAGEYRIPGSDGFSRTITGPCLKGSYRTHYTATGTGPDGVPFDIEDIGWSKLFDVDDCAG